MVGIPQQRAGHKIRLVLSLGGRSKKLGGHYHINSALINKIVGLTIRENLRDAVYKTRDDPTSPGVALSPNNNLFNPTTTLSESTVLASKLSPAGTLL
jgi:hypothetical protein